VPTTTSSPPSILRLSAPLVVSFVMRAAFSLVDTAYAATIGDSAQAAIGLTLPFEFLMIALWVGLSTGLTSRLSRALGAREGEKLEQYLRTTWKLVAILSPVFGVIGAGIWFYAPHMDLAPEVSEAFRIYGTVLICGSALNSFWSIVPDSLVKAHHDTRSTMWAGILSNLINVVLNTLFLFVFHWGIFGIALSTVIGRFGGLFYALHRARQHETRRRAAWTTSVPGLDPRPYRSILALALPAALTFVLMSSEISVVNLILARSTEPTAAIAAMSIYNRIILFAVNPMIAAAVAMLPFAGKLLGEGDVAGVRRGVRQVSIAAFCYIALVVTPVMLFAGPSIAGALSESEVTARFAAFALRLVPIACLATTPFFLCRPIFEAMGRGRPGLAMAMLRYLVLSIPLAWGGLVLFEQMDRPGLHGLLFGLILAAGVTSTLFGWWARSALRQLDSRS
jgi:putative MATE family efflux protein